MLPATHQRTYEISLVQLPAWASLTEDQKSALNLFKSGGYMKGDTCYQIKTLKDLEQANVWIMRQFDPEYLGSVQTTMIIPIFQYHAAKIAGW